MTKPCFQTPQRGPDAWNKQKQRKGMGTSVEGQRTASEGGGWWRWVARTPPSLQQTPRHALTLPRSLGFAPKSLLRSSAQEAPVVPTGSLSVHRGRQRPAAVHHPGWPQTLCHHVWHCFGLKEGSISIQSHTVPVKSGEWN